MGEHGEEPHPLVVPARRAYQIMWRYCSKCIGYYCYCMNHINNHTHVQ